MEVKSQPPAKILESEEEEGYERLIKLLEERLEKHVENRKVIQGKLKEALNKLAKQVDDLEERINKNLGEEFILEDDRLQRTLNELREDNTTSALKMAKVELSVIQSYEITENKKPNNGLSSFYELKTKRRTVPVDISVELAISKADSSTHGPSDATGMSEIACDSKFAEERERIMELLKERLEKHDNSKKAAQDKLHEICERLKAQIVELEDRVNKELEEKFASEDNRLQTALNEHRGNRAVSALQKAKAELLVEQSYEVFENNFYSKRDLTILYELETERRIVPELVEMRKPTNLRVTDVNKGYVSVQFTCFNLDEERVLSDRTIVNPVKYRCLFFKKDNEQEGKEYPLGNNKGDSSSFKFTSYNLEAEATYGTRVRMVVDDREGEWSDEVAEFTTPEFRECCVWKKCPGYVDKDRKYSVDEKNLRVATKVNSSSSDCTIIGNTHIPLNKVTQWSIKIFKSKDNDGDGIYIGIAPFDISQNDVNWDNGWYFYCYYSALYSRPPHNYYGKEYGPRKEYGQYVHTGDSVGVVMDTTKGELSFVLNGVDCGVAYEGIPLDKPLIPCVLLYYKGDSVGLDTSEVKENEVDSSIPVPSNITTKEYHMGLNHLRMG